MGYRMGDSALPLNPCPQECDILFQAFGMMARELLFELTSTINCSIILSLALVKW